MPTADERLALSLVYQLSYPSNMGLSPTIEPAHPRPPPTDRRPDGPWADDVGLELGRAQPRRPLPDSRFGPIEAVGKLAETLATVLVVER